MKTTDPIHFYGPADPHGVFSNFHKTAVTMPDGTKLLTTEHPFQAYKFRGTDEAHLDAILAAPTPGIAARLGRDTTHPIRSDWDTEIRDDMMRVVVTLKVQQHWHVRDLLAKTGYRYIAEHGKDRYWGDGNDGTGDNRLGQIFMEIREVMHVGMYVGMFLDAYLDLVINRLPPNFLDRTKPCPVE